ncbi:hypothetical protein BC831DRAFT_447252, partial [Entophlyctis helioformis]
AAAAAAAPGSALSRPSAASTVSSTNARPSHVSWRTVLRGIRRLPARTETVVHYPRLFAFLLVFLIPYSVSVATVLLFDVFATYIGPSVEFNSASMAFEFGFFAFRYRLTDPGPDALASLAVYATDWTTVTYAHLCGTVRFATKWDPGLLVDPSLFCSRMWMTVQAAEVAALAAGAVGVLLLLYNMLVWSGRSLLLRPTLYKDSHVRLLRKWFKLQINMAVLSHMVLQIYASSLVIFIAQQGYIRWPRNVWIHFGMWCAVFSWIADLVFVILFFCFDQFTFFHTPVVPMSDADIERARREESGNAGENVDMSDDSWSESESGSGSDDGDERQRAVAAYVAVHGSASVQQQGRRGSGDAHMPSSSQQQSHWTGGSTQRLSGVDASNGMLPPMAQRSVPVLTATGTPTHSTGRGDAGASGAHASHASDAKDTPVVVPVLARHADHHYHASSSSSASSLSFSSTAH